MISCHAQTILIRGIASSLLDGGFAVVFVASFLKHDFSLEQQLLLLMRISDTENILDTKKRLQPVLISSQTALLEEEKAQACLASSHGGS